MMILLVYFKLLGLLQTQVIILVKLIRYILLLIDRIRDFKIVHLNLLSLLQTLDQLRTLGQHLLIFGFTGENLKGLGRRRNKNKKDKYFSCTLKCEKYAYSAIVILLFHHY
jgi:hypothetical protein